LAQDFTTLVSYTYPHDAELVALQAQLAQAGLQYYVMDQHFLGVLPFDSQAIGGVKVRVLDSQLGRAQAILDALKAQRPQVLEPIDEEDAAWMAERQAEEALRERDAKRFLTAVKITAALTVGGGLLAWLLP